MDFRQVMFLPTIYYKVSSTSKTILIVDDNPLVRDSLQKALQSEFEVLTAEGGSQALEVLKNHVVDVIVTDIVMPEMDGNTFLDYLNQTLNSPPVIVISGFKYEDNRINSIKKGAIFFLEKPFNSEELKLVIKNILNLKTQNNTNLEETKKALSLVLSHELRTPLMAIYTGSQILGESLTGSIPDDLGKVLLSIKKGSKRLEKLISNLTLFNQINLGLAKTVFEKYVTVSNFENVLTLALRGLYDEMIESQPMLVFEGNHFSTSFKCAESQVSAAIVKIIENCIKFAKERPCIRLRTSLGDGTVWLEIRDNGPGFPKGFSEEQIQFFFQPQRSLLEQQGVGLGLAIAKYLINLNRGMLKIFNNEGAVVILGFKAI